MTEAKRTWLDQRWVARFGEAINGMTGFAVGLEPIGTGTPEAPGSLNWHQSFDLAPLASAWFAAPEETWRELGVQTMRAAGVDPVDDQTARGTYLELLAQGISGIASDFTGEAGRQISPEKGAETAEPFEPGLTWSAFRITFPDGQPVVFHAAWTQELIDALIDAATEASPGGQNEDDHEPLGGSPTAESLLSSTVMRFGQSKTLDLLLDVELPIAISFGRAQVPLKDVLKLTSGSVVELNRTVAEPVEVIVNNCVIARGEVVVIEGNYGVRIQQIISPQERLRTLS